jgi:hypothetical protein
MKADRAKQIKTRVTVNEDPTDKLLRDLKKENQRLKTLLATGKIDPEQLKYLMNGRPPTGNLSIFFFGNYIFQLFHLKAEIECH